MGADNTAVTAAGCNLATLAEDLRLVRNTSAEIHQLVAQAGFASAAAAEEEPAQAPVAAIISITILSTCKSWYFNIKSYT